MHELENLIERAVVLTRGEVIGGGGDLPLSLTECRKETGDGASLTAAVEGLERRLLGISERVLRYKLKKCGLGGG